jgi:hypothetical protein
LKPRPPSPPRALRLVFSTGDAARPPGPKPDDAILALVRALARAEARRDAAGQSET